MIRITHEGAARLDQEDVEEARDHVSRWVELEQSALDKLFDD